MFLTFIFKTFLFLMELRLFHTLLIQKSWLFDNIFTNIKNCIFSKTFTMMAIIILKYFRYVICNWIPGICFLCVLEHFSLTYFYLVLNIIGNFYNNDLIFPLCNLHFDLNVDAKNVKNNKTKTLKRNEK